MTDYPKGPDGQPIVNVPPLPWQQEQLEALNYFATDQTSGSRYYYVDAEHTTVHCDVPSDVDYKGWCNLQTVNEYNAEPDHSEIVKTQQSYKCLTGQNSVALCQQLADAQLLVNPVLYQQGLTLGQQQAQGFINGQKPLPAGQLPQSVAAMVKQLGMGPASAIPVPVKPSSKVTAAFDDSGSPMPQPVEQPDVGGDINDGGSPDTGAASCVSSTCKCLTASNDGIKAALDNIASKLGQQMQPSCDLVTNCMDTIVQQLYKKLYKPTKTCDQCKQDIAAGLAGTLEFALSCAGACINDCQCSSTSSPTDNQPTCDPTSPNYDPTLCGQEPEPEKPKEPKQYIGWCNRDTSETAVTKDGDSVFGPPWESVGTSETESGALALAGQCQSNQIPPTQYEQGLQTVSVTSINCPISEYSNGHVTEALANNSALLNSLEGISQTMNNIGNIGVDGIKVDNLGGIFTGLYRAYTGQAGQLAKLLLPPVCTAFGCDAPGFAKIMQAHSTFGVIEKATGAKFEEFTTPYKYALHSLCRQKQLSPEGASGAFLANAIDLTALDAHYAIAGLCPQAMQAHIEATKAKPNPGQLTELRRRGIYSPSEYQAGMRRLGYLEPAIVEKIYSTTYAVPSIQQTIQFATVGVDNDELVIRQKLDTGFNDYYSGNRKAWLNADGITETHALDAWRSHWETPGVGTLTEFYRRLRHSSSFGPPDMLLSRITESLTQLAISPAWQQEILATMTTPLLRRDAMRCYQYGTIDTKALSSAVEYAGYNDDAVTQVLKLAKILRQRQAAAHPTIKQWIELQLSRSIVESVMGADGYTSEEIEEVLSQKEGEFITLPYCGAYSRGNITKQQLVDYLAGIGVSQAGADAIATRLTPHIIDHPAIKSYVIGTISKDDANQKMVAAGMLPDIINRLLADAEQQIEDTFALVCQKGIKERYLHGELTLDEAGVKLIEFGITGERAEDMKSNWGCEKSSIGRIVPASELCSWVKSGLITATDFYGRLLKLGYTDANASMILDACQMAYNKKQIADAQKQAKAQLAADRRAAAQLKRDQAELLRKQRSMQNANIKRQSLRESRDSKMLKASQYVMTKTGVDLPTAIVSVRDAITSIESTYGIQPSEAVSTVYLAATKYTGGTIQEWLDAVNDLASAVAASPFAGSSEDSDTSPSLAELIQPS